MPFTPFHFGVALLLFAIMPFLDPLALFIGSVIPDIEGITALFILPYSGLPLHGFLHSFLGALVLGILTGGISYFILTNVGISETLNKTLSINITLKKSIISALLGTFSHIMLDAPLYNDMDPFLPFIGNPTDYTDNPLYGIVPFTTPYFICIIGFILGGLILLIQFRGWEQYIDRFERRQLIKKQTVLLLIGIASLTIIVLPVIIFFLNPYNDDVVDFKWEDTCHGAEVAIILSTDSLWITSRKSYKITLIFGVDNINGSSNEVISYNNSYVVLNRIRLDPSYLNLSESPFKQLSDKQGWSIDWYITPNATDPLLRSMGIAKGKRIDYSLHLSVNYTVIDSIGIDWPRMFQNYANISIIGGSDAP